jgi:class 3 adenylate cyclase
MDIRWNNIHNYNNNNDDKYPYQTIFNLYESNLSPDVIASQLDISKNEVFNTLKRIESDKQDKEKSIIEASSSPKNEMINSASTLDIKDSIKDVQKRIWTRLKSKPIFDISIKDTQELLESVVNTNTILVILYVDLVRSTKLSMNLPLNRLAPLIQAFTQEMSIIVDAYGGYVFKFVGDGILSFFFADKNNLHLPCSKAIDCGYSMIDVIEKGINDILEENGYPELKIRIGIDIGENAIVKYDVITNSSKVTDEQDSNMNIYETKNNNHTIKNNKTVSKKKPQFDILGYTINIASKMTQYAKPNQIIIGAALFDHLDEVKKRNFKKIHILDDSWNYIDNSNGNVYGLMVNNNT